MAARHTALLAVLLAAGALPGCSESTDKPAPAPASGQASAQPAAGGAAVVIDAAANPNWLDQYKGKIVLMDFWATWCPPCREAMPGVQKLHEKFRGRPVAMVGVNVAERGDAKGYMAKQGFTYDLVLNGDAMAQQYNVEGIPRFILLSTDGKTVLLDKTGFNPENDVQIAAAIEQELKAKGL